MSDETVVFRADLEVERLRAENAAMRQMVEAVAEHIGGYVSEHFRQCAFCGNGAIESRIIAHASDCEVEQARAFVTAHPATASESAGGDDEYGHDEMDCPDCDGYGTRYADGGFCEVPCMCYCHTMQADDGQVR